MAGFMTQGARQPASGADPPVTDPVGGPVVAPTGRVLAFDLGSRRIGVAASDSGQVMAVGVDTVQRTGDPVVDRHRMVGLIDEYEAVGAVVGLPLTLGGEEGRAAQLAVAEAGALSGVAGVPVVMWDERLTTVSAAGALRSGGKRARQQRQVIDRTAAAVLLQSWLDRRRVGRGDDRG